MKLCDTFYRGLWLRTVDDFEGPSGLGRESLRTWPHIVRLRLPLPPGSVGFAEPGRKTERRTYDLVQR